MPREHAKRQSIQSHQLITQEAIKQTVCDQFLLLYPAE